MVRVRVRVRVRVSLVRVRVRVRVGLGLGAVLDRGGGVAAEPTADGIGYDAKALAELVDEAEGELAWSELGLGLGLGLGLRLG